MTDASTEMSETSAHEGRSAVRGIAGRVGSRSVRRAVEEALIGLDSTVVVYFFVLNTTPPTCS